MYYFPTFDSIQQDGVGKILHEGKDETPVSITMFKIIQV